MAQDDTIQQATQTPELNEGFLHSLATSIGVDPEAVKSTAKAIWENPVEAAKTIGGAQVDEFVDAAQHPVKAARLALKGVISAITNPEAQAAAKARFNEPGFLNKLQGAEEYVTSGIPIFGGGIAKSEEQAGKGNFSGAAGTVLGTLGPVLTETEGAQNLKTHLAETGKTFAESAKDGIQRAAQATAPAGSPEAGAVKIGGAEDPADVVKKAGLVYKGELMKGSDVHMFEHPNHPGKTAALPGPLDVESVKAKMNSKLNEFGVKPEEPEHITFGGLGGKEVKTKPDYSISHEDALPGSIAENTGSTIAKNSKGKEIAHVWTDYAPKASDIAGTNTAEINHSIVDRDLQGQGIGTAIYTQAIEKAREKGFDRIVSDTDRSPEANRLWTSLAKKYPVETIGTGENVRYAVDLTAPQGGHAGGGVASVEELNRPGQFVKMNRAGQITNQNKTPDFNLQKGEVGFQVMPDGTYHVAAGTPTPSQEAAIKIRAANLYPNAAPEHLQTFAKRGELPKQTVNLGDAYGDTGRYVGGLHEEQTPNTYELSGDEENAYHPDLQKLADHFGVSEDASKLKDGASFITPDGKFVHLAGGTTHDSAIDWATGSQQIVGDNRPEFLKNTGVIRTRFNPNDRQGPTMHISVPEQGATPEQIPAIRQAIAAAGRNGNVRIERADVTPETKDALTFSKEFPRSSDAENYLRKIQSHPDQQEKPRGGSVKPTVQGETGAAVAPNEKLQASAQKYAKAQGMAEIDHSPVKADPARATEIARIYDEAKHDPNDPRVKAAYDALKTETLAQFHHLRDDLGLKFEPQEKDPYKSAGEMMKDIRDNNRLKVFTGSSTGEDHPLSEVAPGTGGHTYNTVFRWVHDAMGHAAGGNDFSENGEKSATEAHAQMYSDTARPAMRNETEGQTSWFFHNPKIVSGEAEPGEFAPQKASLLPDTSADWHEKAGAKATVKGNVAGGINPRTGKADTKGFGTEIMPELRQPLDHAPTAQDFLNYYNQHHEIFDKYPELRVGWDNTSAVPGGHELNVAAVGPEAARVAKKLDQKSAFDIAKDDIIPTRGSGLRTEFPNYSIEERIKDLKGENQSDIAGFEHLSKPIYDNLEPDEREYLKGNKTLQRNVMQQYHKLQPSVNETTNAMQAGAALGGWWQRYIDIFHNLTDDESQAAADVMGPSHAEILKQWHAALSANKSVGDANNLAWHSYADWLDAGKPTDRNSIDEILKQNGAQPEDAEKKGNAAMSDTRDRRGKLLKEGTDTSKLFNLVNSPEMMGERPFHSEVFSDDTKRNPLMGKGEGYRKVPSMGATVAGKGNLNRLVIDTHMRDFYGQPPKGPAAQYIADSVHLRQAAEALGLKGGEGQEQLWGTVLGLKTLLKEGLTPAEASGKLSAAVINSIGKDYAEVIANDPEITKPGGLLDRLKEQHNIGRGSAGFSEAYSKTRGTRTGEGQPAGGEAPTNQTELAKTAQRIRGQISDTKIKKVELGEHAGEDEGDTSFEFGANTPIPKKMKQNAAVADNMRDPDVRFNAARHEAAHAVINELLNPGSVNATAITSGGGMTDVEPPHGAQTVGQLNDNDIRNIVGASYAGGLSEPGGTTATHVSGDQAYRAQILAGRGNTAFGRAPELEAEARARVNALLADPKVQKHIDNVATQINTRLKLSGDEVRAIMKSQK